MAIPTFDQFIEPLFRVLEKSQDGMRSAEVYEAERFNFAADVVLGRSSEV